MLGRTEGTLHARFAGCCGMPCADYRSASWLAADSAAADARDGVTR
jgi:hypothetical protein